ncbi:MAG: DUF2142 domain-containing protein [Erysipelotrichaceae bacterium]
MTKNKSVILFIKNYIVYLYLLLLVTSIAFVGFFANTTYESFSEIEANPFKGKVLEMKDGDCFSQIYSFQYSELKSLQLKYDNENETTGSLSVQLFNQDNKKQFEQEFDLTAMKGKINVNTGHLKGTISEHYKLTLNYHNDNQNNISIYSQDMDNQIFSGKLNGSNNNLQVLLSSSGYDTSYNVILIGFSLIIWLCSLLLLFYEIMKKPKMRNCFDDFINFLEKKKIMFAAEFIFFIIILFNGFVIYYNYSYYRLINLPLLILFISAFAAFIVYFLKIYIKCKGNYARMFLLLAIPISLCYWLFLIPDSTPDEPVHFLKTYLVSTFDFSGTSIINIPNDYVMYGIRNYYNIVENIFQHTDYSATYLSNQAVTYNFIMYIVPSIALYFSRLFQISLFGSYYFAKLANTLVYLFLGYKAIKMVPIGKLIFFTLLLNPMLIHQAVSLNADCLLHAILILFVAYVLKIKFSENKLSYKNIMILSLFLLFILLAKYVYLPLFALTFILYDKVEKKDYKKIFTFFGSCLMMIIVYFVIFTILARKVVPVPYITNNNISTTEQLKYLLSNPFIFFNILFHTLVYQGKMYITTFAGVALSWLNLYINEIIVFLYLLLLFISPFFVKENKKWKFNERFWMVLIFGGNCLLIILGLYLTWTNVGGYIVEGVQGRYFIPIILLLLLSYSNINLREKFKKRINTMTIETIYFVGLLLINLFVLFKILIFFTYA